MREIQRPRFDQCVRSHAAKRESILDAAAAVFCREGFGGANIDLIAAEAGVSRQTVYNHHGDKENLFAAVVRDISERCNARIFAVLNAFPDHPQDLEAELVAFAIEMTNNCLCDRDGKFLRKLLQAEGDRYPELFAVWRENGPGRIWKALGARFARLALDGHLEINDPDVAARQFFALANADLQLSLAFGEPLSDEQIRTAAKNAVRTFLRAYGRREAAAPAVPGQQTAVA